MDRPVVPFRQFVLKMHSRCDLACDHCYIYEHADTSWRGRPKASSGEVLTRTAERIAEHARAHGLGTVHVVLHGGEPLLAGLVGLRRAAAELNRALSGVCALDLRIHTNGVLLDERFCDLFAEYGIKVGISLDGDRAANDRHRRYADGRSSHPQVIKAVTLLREPRYRHLYAGLLCTIDVANDPVAVYDALLELEPPRIDFLLPHATWEQPPPRPDGRPEPYADWLLTVFDRWESQRRPVPVRIFDSVLRTLSGRSSLTESLGLDPADLVVIETDGTLEQADSLKTAFDGAPATGFDVFADSFDAAARHPGMIDRQQGLAGLSGQCRSCPVVRSCGGGLYAHRYREGSGFDNPSVFCPDLMKLITHLDARTVHERATATADPAAAPAAAGSLLTGDQLAELASGYGGAETVRLLAAEQLDIARTLLGRVWHQAADPDRSARAAWELLTALDADAAGAQALDAVLGHPYTRTWAVRCLTGEPGPAADLGGLAELAAAAALRAGLAEPVAVPVRAGLLRLPGLGVLRLPGCSEAVVRAAEGGFTVRAAGTGGESGLRVRWAEADGRWQPLRRITAPASGALGPWTVALEDTDPQRDSHQWPVQDRLDSGAFAAWEGALAGAWRFVTAELPGYAPGLAAGLATVTPLRPGTDGREVSAAARQAFGAVGIARPGGPGAAGQQLLAQLLVHEFQHVKLGAVLDFHDLYDPQDDRLFYAPWRPDPRPLEMLLQGTYAHLAVVEFWRAVLCSQAGAGSGVDAEAARQAAFNFAYWRSCTAEAAQTLADSGSLTPLGLRFAVGLRDRVAPWLDESVESGALIAAQRSLEATRADWSARTGAGTARL
ncbi:FxsB family radical SAM/SPASM domain protein [Streptacidiphilus sp. PB12-B1b]|uniref:FxsB family cyclophane-forming radical SAM/SPASM peptide maturase n=1 Tax=Streptacidiphilus sp. PB12-B1b TaxID=2705012 RepID=UPI001CDC626B|nr:FxsB family cyclophane-forming radical SAM/SPASM peptide maturase [Streptacidiphilus sp. PB12-B1b]QMU74966.1 FxsB family radical SAM/SPASM domain protein [Streptacidiphilus sp. PB12-B1b]